MAYEGEVTTDGARGGGERVGGTEDGTASLDGVTAFPDHGADGTRAHIYWRQMSASVGGGKWSEMALVDDVQAMRPGKKGFSLKSA
jgi:hypothetical protein